MYLQWICKCRANHCNNFVKIATNKWLNKIQAWHKIMYFDIFFITFWNNLVIGDRPCLEIAVVTSCTTIFQRQSNKIILPITYMTTHTLLANICFLFYVLDPGFNYLSLAVLEMDSTVQFCYSGSITLPKTRDRYTQKMVSWERCHSTTKKPKAKNSGKHSPHTDQQFVVFTLEITRFLVPKMMLSI